MRYAGVRIGVFGASDILVEDLGYRVTGFGSWFQAPEPEYFLEAEGSVLEFLLRPQLPSIPTIKDHKRFFKGSFKGSFKGPLL